MGHLILDISTIERVASKVLKDYAAAHGSVMLDLGIQPGADDKELRLIAGRVSGAKEFKSRLIAQLREEIDK